MFNRGHAQRSSTTQTPGGTGTALLWQREEVFHGRRKKCLASEIHIDLFIGNSIRHVSPETFPFFTPTFPYRTPLFMRWAPSEPHAGMDPKRDGSPVQHGERSHTSTETFLRCAWSPCRELSLVNVPACRHHFYSSCAVRRGALPRHPSASPLSLGGLSFTFQGFICLVRASAL